MTESFWTVLLWFNYVVLVYFAVLNTVYLVTGIFAFNALRRYAFRMKSIDLEDLITSSGAPPITLIVPAYNEEANCLDAIDSLLKLNYPEYEILVVNDGSTDGTLELLKGGFNLTPVTRIAMAELETEPVRNVYRSRRHPNLWVLDKQNGGKADALNAGLNYCRTPLFCALDADTLVERDALIRIVRPFLENASTVAAGGIIRIANGCRVRQGQLEEVRLPRSFLARLQVLEYLRAFLSGRMGWDALDATLVISGAFGAFRRSVVVDAGGYAPDTVGEDMELVVRLHRHCREKQLAYDISFVPDPVAWTEAPERLRGLARQRNRWQRGLLQSLLRHKKMLFNPRYGRSGLLAYPYFFFLEMLGPVIELLGYAAFIITVLAGRASTLYMVTFFIVAVLFGFLLSASAVSLEELMFRRYPRFRDLIRLFGLAFIENFGYRQLTTWWRFTGVISAAFNPRGWGKQHRKGFGDGSAEDLVPRGGVIASALVLVAAGLAAAAGSVGAQERPGTSYRLGVDYDYANFNESLDDWHDVAVQLDRRADWGTLIGRVNYARHFARNGLQFEADAYPRLGDGRYAYLNLGFSGSRIYPEVRAGGEVYTGLPGSNEASLGFRHLRFRSSDVTLWTGSVAKYAGNYWISLRPYFMAGDGDRSISGSLSVRRYGAGRDDYWGISVGAGAGASEIETVRDLERVDSYRVRLEGRLPYEARWVGSWSLAYEHEELDFGRTRDRIAVGVGFRRILP